MPHCSERHSRTASEDPPVTPAVSRPATRRKTAGASEPADRELFDDEVERAVRRLQQRHGVEADGVAGKYTLPELIRSLEERIQQIVVTLERWRWLLSPWGLTTFS